MGDISKMFKRPKPAATPRAPDPADERARMAAQQALAKTGGKGTTILTQGLAAPIPRSPEVKAPRTVLTGGA